MANTPRIPHIPPIRTDTQEPQQSSTTNRPPAQGASNGANSASNGGSPQHRTSKEWYYYWKQVGDQVVQNTQTLAGLVTYGPHADRPDPSTVPNGAIAVESDRGAIYQNELINGVPTWFYVAGTMWGTFSPDQRPTDLGAHDAGFDFRTTDDPAREFIWSQTKWIEATPVRYGTHAARLAVDVTAVIDQMLWVEGDRGAIYQLQPSGSTHVWQYLAGTMWGTLSPDQRPTDLGTHDAGFDFRGTDQQREFIWSQAAWVETTPVVGSSLTHANVVTRVGSTGQIVESGITDLSAADSNTVYITAANNVGIGTTSALTILHLARSSPGALAPVLTLQNLGGAAEDQEGITFVSGGSNRAQIRSTAHGADGYAGTIEFATGLTTLTERMRISGTGNIGMGTASPGYLLQLASDSAAKPGTNTWTIASDIRTKRNVHRFEGDIEVIRKLDPIAAEYNGLGGTPEGARVVSFDAAKLREIVPQCVSSAKGKLNADDAEETDLLGVNTHELFFHLLRAVQQIDRRVTALEGKNP